MKTDELTNIKRQRLMQRAHQIAKCIKIYQQPLAKYSLLLADAIRQAAREWKQSVMREAVRLNLQNKYGYSEDKAYTEVASLSDYQVNLDYHTYAA